MAGPRTKLIPKAAFNMPKAAARRSRGSAAGGLLGWKGGVGGDELRLGHHSVGR
jgi:hypothetical protein